MGRTKICISFDYENDRNSRNAIRLWNTNKNIDFDIIDKTPNEIDTYDISRIKAGLTLKINQADILLVISGNYINTPHKDKDKIGCINWQNWECKKALELGKKVLLVKLDYNSAIPTELYGKKRVDIVGLELEKVKRAITTTLWF